MAPPIDSTTTTSATAMAAVAPLASGPWRAITVTATLKAPAGWKHGGSLDVDRVDGNTIRYAPTSLELLNDHPVLLGEHFRSITLWPAGSAPGERDSRP